MAKQNTTEFAVIGLGRFGSNLALTLEELGYSVLGIDQSKEIVQRLAPMLTQAVALDATDENALRAIDMAAFQIAIVAIGSSFEANLMTLVALKAIGVRQVICKALTDRQREILLRVGADRVVQPERDAGTQLAHELTTPNALAHVALGKLHSITELLAPERLCGKALYNIQDMLHQATVLVVKRGEVLNLMPAPEFVVQAGDLLVLLGTNSAISSVELL